MKRLSSFFSFFLLHLSLWSQQEILFSVIDKTNDTLRNVNIKIHFPDSNWSQILQGATIIKLPMLTSIAMELDWNGERYFHQFQIADKQINSYTWVLNKEYQLQEVIVSAQQLQVKSFVSNHVLNKADIDILRSEKDIPYVIQKLPSVVVQSDAGNGVGYTAFRLRGIDPSHIQCNINGIPMTDAESSLTYFVDIPDILNSTNELVLWKGNIPSRAGPGNFGAAIDLQTHTFSERPSTSIRARLASYNTGMLSIQMQSKPTKSNLQFSLNASGQKSDGFIERSASTLGSLSLAAQQVRRKNHWKLIYLLGGEKTQQAWFGLPHSYFGVDSLFRFNVAGTSKEGDPYANEIDNYFQQHVQFFYNVQFNGNSLLTVTANYTNGFGYFENYIANALYSTFDLSHPDKLSGDLVRRKHLSNHFYFGSLQYQSNWMPGKKWWIGIQSSYYLGNHFGKVSKTIDESVRLNNPEYYRNKGLKFEFSPYVKWELVQTTSMQVFADFQIRHINYNISGLHDIYGRISPGRTYTFYRPMLFFVYQFNEKWNLNASTGFMQREPFREELLSDPKNTLHEKLWNNELGFSWTGKHVSLKHNFYFMKYKDQLAVTGALNDVGESRKINIPSSFRLGMETQLSWKIKRRILAFCNINLSRNAATELTEYIPMYDAQFTNIGQMKIIHNNRPLALSPSIVANGGIDYTLLHEKRIQPKCIISYIHNYVGKQYLDNTGSDYSKLPDYMLGGIALLCEKKIKKRNSVTLQLHVNNIWNKKYATHGWIARYFYEDANGDFGPYAQRETGGHVSYKGLYPQALTNANISLGYRF